VIAFALYLIADMMLIGMRVFAIMLLASASLLFLGIIVAMRNPGMRVGMLFGAAFGALIGWCMLAAGLAALFAM
jgi:hypothetical protein